MESKPIVGVITNETVGFNGRQLSHSAGKRYVDAVMNFADIVPILIPVLVKLDINLTWFGILVAVNLQTAWLSPPVALSAYFLKGVVPEWDLKDIYFGMMQFMVIQLIGLALIFLFPQIALWLPNYIYGQ